MTVRSPASALLRRIPLTPKMLALTFLVGLVIWGVLDTFQMRRIREISDRQLAELIGDQAREDRIRFDRYMISHAEMAELCVSRQAFSDYLIDAAGFRSHRQQVLVHEEVPSWLPDNAVMRHFTVIRTALLLDAGGTVREIYQARSESLPRELLPPSGRLLQLSQGQSFLTTLDGVPYLLAGQGYQPPDGSSPVTLLLATPLDEGFLLASQQGTSAHTVALLDPERNVVVASNAPDDIPAGTLLADLKGDYVLTSRHHFDWGGSDLALQFASLISRNELATMSQSMREAERLLRGSMACALILAFSGIMLWMTREIQRLTGRIAHVSQELLGAALPEEVSGGDQLHILERRFDLFFQEIIASRQRLQRQAAELLQEKTVYLDTLLHSPAMAVVATDTGLRIKYFNSMAEQLFGGQAREAIGRAIPQAAPGPLAEVFAGAATLAAGEERLHTAAVRAGGQERILELRLTTVSDASGLNSGYLLLAQDVTARVQAERQIRDLNLELEERVRQRTQELEAANSELRDFAYVVSHDLKAPLRAINQLASWIATDYARVLGDHGREQLGLLVSRVRRMHALIDGILQYSRVGRVREERQPVDTAQVVREAIEVVHPPPGITIIANDPLPVVPGEPTRIAQVFQNLLSNAVRHMGRPEGEVRVSAASLEDAWEFAVRDNGPGIDPRYHDKIFQIFQTLASRDEQESTGVGLAIAKKIVELHGGTIRVESEAGQGAAFLFTLPKSAPAH
ncbi:MAG: ATP-binding protein [Thermodesulfobacteriota bacterium]